MRDRELGPPERRTRLARNWLIAAQTAFGVAADETGEEIARVRTTGPNREAVHA